jgi:hypothetical protein
MPRRRRRPDPPEPYEGDDVKVVTIGTVLWAVAFVALVPFYGQLARDGRGWWAWTCLAGFGLGLFGIEYCRRGGPRSRATASARPRSAGRRCASRSPRPG